MKKHILTFTLIFCCFQVLVAQNYEGNQADIDAILKNVKAFSAVLMRGDYEAVHASYTNDGKIFPQGKGIIEGQTSLASYWKAREGQKIAFHQLFPQEIKILGDHAYDYGYYKGTTTFEDGRAAQSWCGKYVVVWKKVGNDWKMYLDAWNRVNPENMPLELWRNEVTFQTKDNITLYGDIYETNQGKDRPMILLFHQAGSNGRGEYKNIISPLLSKGYNVFCIDQRNGAQRFEHPNRTVSKLKKEYSYCETYPDLEAAFEFVEKEGFTGKKAIWGSSYSAALVVQLGANHPERVQGVLAFSPAAGGPLKDCNPNDYFPTIKTPLLVLRPEREMEHESVKKQFELAKEHNHQTFVAKNGVHGSSMLDETRTKADTSETWKVVFSFLEKVFEDKSK